MLFLEELHKPITNTMGEDLRTLDFKSGQLEVVRYLRAMYEKRRAS